MRSPHAGGRPASWHLGAPWEPEAPCTCAACVHPAGHPCSAVGALGRHCPLVAAYPHRTFIFAVTPIPCLPHSQGWKTRVTLRGSWVPLPNSQLRAQPQGQPTLVDSLLWSLGTLLAGEKRGENSYSDHPSHSVSIPRSRTG